MANSSRKAPRWQCRDCARIFHTKGGHPGLEHVSDMQDVFSKHRGGPRNICPDCGGALHPLPAE